MPALPSSPPLPASSTVVITPEVRLAYVLQHFWRAYPTAPKVAVGYEQATTGVSVVNGAGTFFAEATPYPPEPNWREWLGQRVPFFFDGAPEQPLLTLAPGAATINADIISAAFYLLGGWQEYFAAERDWHGRFPYAASVQHKYGFVAIPVVNYYFDVLKAAVEHVAGRTVPRRRWQGAAFAAFVTHDIDNLRGGWSAAARLALRQGQVLKALKLVVDKALGRPAPWDNLEQVQAETAHFGAPSTFFILGSQQCAPNGTANADYDAAAPAFRERLRQLQRLGAEIASHGSYGTAEDGAAVHQEISALQLIQPIGNRFHYLCWEPRRTPGVLARAGVGYDSTLGFAEHFGFRNSYCLPFFPFDFQHGRAYPFLEIPLNVMDATLHHPNYLHVPPDVMLPTLQPLLEQIERFGGVATVLWHNENFAPANQTNGPQQFAELMTYLQQHGAIFLTGSQIVAELCPE